MEHTQEQQSFSQMPSGMGYYPIDSKADLLDKIRPEEVVEQIKQRLMGKEYDTISERWILNPALKDIALTEVGASAITNLMFSASTRSVSISNLKDDEIKKRLLNIIKTSMKMCLDNWESYGIKCTSQLYFVKEIVFTNTWVVLKQPENEGIRRLINSTIQEQRSVSTYGEQKSGVINSLFRRNK